MTCSHNESVLRISDANAIVIEWQSTKYQCAMSRFGICAVAATQYVSAVQKRPATTHKPDNHTLHCVRFIFLDSFLRIFDGIPRVFFCSPVGTDSGQGRRARRRYKTTTLYRKYQQQQWWWWRQSLPTPDHRHSFNFGCRPGCTTRLNFFNPGPVCGPPHQREGGHIDYHRYQLHPPAPCVS